MKSASIVDILKEKRSKQKTRIPLIRKKVFGIETCAQRFIGKVLISFIKIVVQERELTVKIHEILYAKPTNVKPTVVSIQLGDKPIWKYTCDSIEDLNCRTILHYDQEYLLMILKDEKIKEIIRVADLVTKHL